jgi:hypothetical protein
MSYSDPSLLGDPAAFGEHGRVGIEADRLLEQMGEPDREDARPAAAVEQPPAPVEPQLLGENGLELRRVGRPPVPVVGRGALEERRVDTSGGCPPRRVSAPLPGPIGE